MLGIYNKPAFTLIELLLALLIMGILASIALPALTKRQPRQEREQFIAQLNSLMAVAWRQALVSGKPTKVIFSMFAKKEGAILVEELTGQYDSAGNALSRPVKATNAIIRLPQRYLIKNFFIERFDEMKRYMGERKEFTTWFFVMPNGLAQEVTINLVDTQDKYNGKFHPVGLVLNPFTAQFKIYNEFQKS